jgi:hypothetical protein
VFFYKNRLGFAVDEGVVLSRAGDFGNFYRMTVLDLLDDDTINVNASETSVTLINSAVPFNEGMMLFASKVQLRLNHGEVLSPTSVGLDAVTKYVMSPRSRPVRIGSDVYFVSEDGRWARVWEYYVKDEGNTSDAADVTGHVPRYIPAGIHGAVGSSDHDFLMLLTDGAPNRVYLYKFYWANAEDKAQSAWSYWEFSADTEVLSAAVLGDEVYLVMQRADGVYLERCNVASGTVADGLDFQLFMDRRVAVQGVWLETPGKTEFILPYEVAEAQRADFRVAMGAAFTESLGGIITVDPEDYEWIDASTVRVPGNFSAGPCFCGLLYDSEWTPSKVFMRNSQDVPIVTGRLVLSGWTVYFKDTAYFETEVAPYGTDPDIESVIPARLAEFDGRTLGEIELVLGQPDLTTGAYTAQVYGDAKVAKITFTNRSPYASTFTQAEWTGIYHNVARTIG